MLEIQGKLNQLSKYQAQQDAEALAQREAKQKAVDAVLTDEIKAQIAAIEAEFAGRDEVVEEKIMTLTAEIKADVLKLGKTVPGDYLQAVWLKGRTSWDDPALEGYFAEKPELLQQFKKTGKPSVSIRKK
jgi:hypothetical protein